MQTILGSGGAIGIPLAKELVAEYSYEPQPFRGSLFKLKKHKILTAEGWKRFFE